MCVCLLHYLPISDFVQKDIAPLNLSMIYMFLQEIGI